MNVIYAHIILLVPDLDCLTQTELKKEDISMLDRLKQPQLDRAHRTDYIFFDTSSADFRRRL